jgi:hypothetical protein
MNKDILDDKRESSREHYARQVVAHMHDAWLVIRLHVGCTFYWARHAYPDALFSLGDINQPLRPSAHCVVISILDRSCHFPPPVSKEYEFKNCLGVGGNSERLGGLSLIGP